MRILTVTNMYPGPEAPFFGTFVRDHVESLRSLGIDVDVFFTDVTRGRRTYVTDVKHLRERLRATRYDVVHAHHTFCVMQSVAAGARKRRMPLLLTCHEGELFVPRGVPNPEARGLKRIVYDRRFKKVAMRTADRVVVVERSLPRLAGYEGPFDVIPPGVDVGLFAPGDRSAARREIGWETGERVIFFPASPTRAFLKGFDLFEEAVKELSGVRIASGGTIAHDRMPLYMNAADVVVQTSRYEASPMIVKEAMACSRPIVATRAGDVEETLGDLPGHHVCDSTPAAIAAAIRAALDFDGPTRGRARLLALDLSLERVAQRYRDVYDRLCRRAAAA